MRWLIAFAAAFVLAGCTATCPECAGGACADVRLDAPAAPRGDTLDAPDARGGPDAPAAGDADDAATPCDDCLFPADGAAFDGDGAAPPFDAPAGDGPAPFDAADAPAPRDAPADDPDAGPAPPDGLTDAPGPRDLPAVHDAPGDPDTPTGPDTAPDTAREAGDTPAPASGLESKGLWVWGSTIRGAEAAFLDALAPHGISDVFVLIKGVSGGIRHDVLDQLLALRTERGLALRIWAWVIAFDDESYADDFAGAWVDPEDPDYRAGLLTLVDDTLAAHTPDGLMLDAVRYPGNAAGRTEPITTFCAAVATRVAAHNAAHGTAVRTGAAVMPELGGANEAAYGQDVAALAGPLDVIAPMVYRYNYAAGTAWVTAMTAATQDEAGGNAAVWPIVLDYAGDETPTPLAADALRADILAALAPCPPGFSVFQYAQLAAAHWPVLDAFAVGSDVCATPPPAPADARDAVVYHQQPLGSNDPGPFSTGGGYEGWCAVASLYMALHRFVPDLPARLQALAPTWRGWRGDALPATDGYFYNADTTYAVEEFLQRRYLGSLVGAAGIGFSGIRTLFDGVVGELGLDLTFAYVPLAELRNRLAVGGVAIVNNWEWGGHYFVIAYYEAGADPSDPAERFYWVLDPTNIEAGNGAILDHLDATRTAQFRANLRAREACGSVDCESARLGLYVLDANGVNAIFRGAQEPADSVILIAPR